jgi:hypothetical protein
MTRRLEEDIVRYGGIVDLTLLPVPTLPGAVPALHRVRRRGYGATHVSSSSA